MTLAIVFRSKRPKLLASSFHMTEASPCPFPFPAPLISSYRITLMPSALGRRILRNYVRNDLPNFRTHRGANFEELPI